MAAQGRVGQVRADLASVQGRAETVASVQHDVSSNDSPLSSQHVDLHLTAARPKRAVDQLLFSYVHARTMFPHML